MKKWLVIAGLVLIVALVMLLRETVKQEATAAVAPAKPAEQPAPTIASVPPPVEDKQPAPAPPTEPTKVEKYDTQSDEFFYKHDEVVIPNIMRSAVKCWEPLDAKKKATFHRNQNIVIKFKQKIRDGKVTMHDIEVERSTWNDPAIEACFKTQLLATTWTDEKLPDWDQEDVIKISPRVLKKYTRENIEYVGPEAPKVPRMITGDELKKDFDPNYKE